MKLFLIKTHQSYIVLSKNADDAEDALCMTSRIDRVEIRSIEELDVSILKSMESDKNIQTEISDALTRCVYFDLRRNKWIFKYTRNHPNYSILNYLFDTKVQILSCIPDMDNHKNLKENLSDYIAMEYNVDDAKISWLPYLMKDSSGEIDIDVLESLIKPDEIKIILINDTDIKVSTLLKIYEIYNQKPEYYRLRIIINKDYNSGYKIIYGTNNLDIKKIDWRPIIDV